MGGTSVKVQRCPEDELSPSNDSLFTRVCGLMVLKGELKDRDNVGSLEASECRCITRPEPARVSGWGWMVQVVVTSSTHLLM